jgi:hypothetical protein
MILINYLIADLQDKAFYNNYENEYEKQIII